MGRQFYLGYLRNIANVLIQHLGPLQYLRYVSYKVEETDYANKTL